MGVGNEVGMCRSRIYAVLRHKGGKGDLYFIAFVTNCHVMRGVPTTIDLRIVVNRRVTTQEQKLPNTFIHLGREGSYVKCLSQQHNAMPKPGIRSPASNTIPEYCAEYCALFYKKCTQIIATFRQKFLSVALQ